MKYAGKTGIPFLLVLHAALDGGLEVDAVFPFLAGDGEQRVPWMIVHVLDVKAELRLSAVRDGVDGEILLDELPCGFH